MSDLPGNYVASRRVSQLLKFIFASDLILQPLLLARVLC